MTGASFAATQATGVLTGVHSLVAPFAASIPLWNVGGCYDDCEHGEYAGSERKRGIAKGALTKAPIKPIDRRRIEDRSDVYSQYLNGTPMTYRYISVFYDSAWRHLQYQVHADFKVSRLPLS
jgi:hypothetical protein